MPAAGSSDAETAPPDERLGYLEEKHLLRIAQGMGMEWKQLGVRLGLSWKRIQQIWSDKRQLPESIMDMLTEWRKQQNYETNQVEIMCRALKEQGLTELANKIFGSQMSEVKEANVNAGEDTSRRLPTTHHEYDASLDDQDLLFICEDLGSDWRRLGVRLGLGWNKINVIADNNTLKDAVMETLVTWRDGQSTNQMPIMLSALREQRLVQVAERLCERRGYTDDLEAAANPPQVSTQHRIVRGYIPDAVLLFVAEMMGRGWKAVARSLGITEAEIDDVDTKFQRQIVEATLEMLVRWRNRQESNVNQLTTLKAALIENDNKIVADKLDAHCQHT
ncbi:uncharacterized protein LOC117124866 [Anneissia japonica]|uniref:uncharacterized protein LOC117124866 n=1 Tax=Anneissia japonica TaxID=1529436 RepID=UPI0014258F3A|nr:uncharacterized protein LOC117124866 [Anneissia japonica]